MSGLESGRSPVRGPLRVLRVGALGGTSLLLATGAHLAGGGRLPSVATLTVLASLLGMVAAVVTARRCRLPLLFVVLGLEQAALHYVLTASTAATTLGCVPAGHQHLGTATGGCLLPGDAMTGMASGPGATSAMLVGHLLAVVATAWLLAGGEAWVWGLAERLIRSTVVAVSALPVLVRSGTPVGVTPAVAVVPGALGSPRGPPTWAS